MLAPYPINTRCEAGNTGAVNKLIGDGQDYYRISDCSSNRLLPHFVTNISDAVLE